ncbi:MAG: hypothetical protein KF889_15275 [Alphaproteobacteria bacterium]|nr:hypothetical protein [Alphaproteobacteria bacterium]MCW5740263.1 hypothetical protein [Alphaproteobacteria bacterium]
MTYIPLSVCVAALLVSYLGASFQSLAMFYLARQDRWLLVGAAVIALLAAWSLRGQDTTLPPFRWSALATALALVVLCYAGHYWLLSGYALSRDEQMALFDAHILASGRLVAPLPAEWMRHADALNIWFMLPVRQPSAWVSAYLPMNAALHAAVSKIADMALTGPLLVGIGAIALHGCVRRLWPTNREAPLIALMLYVGSGQIILTGMTSYAMSAHLALNLVWLWLYLQQRRMADTAALGIGFVATGLHQPLFHPLFVAPVLALLLMKREWRRAAFFAVGYGIVCVFWLLWPTWMVSLVAGPESVVAASGVDYLTRLIDTLHDWEARGFVTMLLNGLRFLSWQHVLLLPLVLASLPAIRRGGLPAALACGLMLTLCVMLIILPYQGHGFGYRYIHGLIGSLILLAVFGWTELVSLRTASRMMMVRTTVGGLLVLLPVQAWMAHELYAAYARTSRAIARAEADFATIVGKDAHSAQDLVINHPDLSNRPVRLIAEYVNEPLVAQLCRSQPRIVLFNHQALSGITAYFGHAPPNPAPRTESLPSALRAAGCRVSVPR